MSGSRNKEPLLCRLGLHKWHGCHCARRGCDKTEHLWEGCVCPMCGQTRHEWDGCCCLNCKETRNEKHKWHGCECRKCGETRHNWDDDCKCGLCGEKSMLLAALDVVHKILRAHGLGELSPEHLAALGKVRVPYHAIKTVQNCYQDKRGGFFHIISKAMKSADESAIEVLWEFRFLFPSNSPSSIEALGRVGTRKGCADRILALLIRHADYHATPSIRYGLIEKILQANSADISLDMLMQIKDLPDETDTSVADVGYGGLRWSEFAVSGARIRKLVKREIEKRESKS